MDIDWAKAFVRTHEATAPDVVAWGKSVIERFTSYSCRRYGSAAFFCWADCDVVNPDTGRSWLCDPWPASRYPRVALLAQLVYAKLNNPGLAIASAVSYAGTGGGS